MKKSVRKNFRLSEFDCFYISALRNRLPQGCTESEVIRFALQYSFDRIAAGNLSDIEEDHYSQLIDKFRFEEYGQRSY